MIATFVNLYITNEYIIDHGVMILQLKLYNGYTSFILSLGTVWFHRVSRAQRVIGQILLRFKFRLSFILSSNLFTNEWAVCQPLRSPIIADMLNMQLLSYGVSEGEMEAIWWRNRNDLATKHRVNNSAIVMVTVIVVSLRCTKSCTKSTIQTSHESSH